MSNDTVFVKDKDLLAFSSKLFSALGMSKDDAHYAGQCIVQSNLWGTDSHGVIRLPIYIERLENGSVKSKPDIRVIKEFGGMARMHGGDGLGYIVGRDAMKKAISLARIHGIGSVIVSNSNHFGAAGLYAREAAKEGMIAIVMSNTIPNMVAPGGQGSLIGNHPIAFAVPLPGASPFVLDCCLSQVAQGKLLVAKEKGQKIPSSWAVDKDGNPTDDPALGLGGSLLPMGGHKGYGMAIVVEFLTGILSGGAFLGGLKSMYKNATEPSGMSHHMLVLNPLAILDDGEWSERVHTLRDKIKTAPVREPGSSLVFPGEPEEACEAQRQAEGIPIPKSLFDSLNALGARFSATLPSA